MRFADGLQRTVDWYRDNEWWWEPIRSGDYRAYYERQYGRRCAGASRRRTPLIRQRRTLLDQGDASGRCRFLPRSAFTRAVASVPVMRTDSTVRPNESVSLSAPSTAFSHVPPRSA